MLDEIIHFYHLISWLLLNSRPGWASEPTWKLTTNLETVDCGYWIANSAQMTVRAWLVVEIDHRQFRTIRNASQWFIVQSIGWWLFRWLVVTKDGCCQFCPENQPVLSDWSLTRFNFIIYRPSEFEHSCHFWEFALSFPSVWWILSPGLRLKSNQSRKGHRSDDVAWIFGWHVDMWLLNTHLTLVIRVRTWVQLRYVQGLAAALATTSGQWTYHPAAYVAEKHIL